MAAPKVYSCYDVPPGVGQENNEPSKTRQSEAKDCDVNVIMKRYEKDGILPLNGREPFFADVSAVGDYRTAIHNVRQAEAQFLHLPLSVRQRFDHDAAAFLDFAVDPANKDEMIRMGIWKEEEKVAPVVVEPPAKPA